MPRSWYVLKTKPRAEEKVEALLMSKEVEVYLPKVKSKRPGRWMNRLEPLFPGYIFVHADVMQDEWLRTRSAPGVAYALGSDHAPSTVPEVIINGIRRRLEECRGVLLPRFVRGESVQIIRGPFVGLEAVFDSQLSGAARSRVLLSILGRLTPLSISVYDLRRTG